MTLAGLGPARSRSSCCSASPRRSSAGTSRTCYEGGPSRGSTASFGPVERLIYRVCRIDPEREQRWNVYALVAARVQRRRRSSSLYADPADPERPAVQPDRRRQRHAGARVQHRGQLRHEHELAELLPRDDDEPPHPDDGAHGAELRVGRGRHGGDGRADPRPRACRASARSATSGSTSCARRCASCCRSRSCSRVVLVVGGVIQNTHGFHDGARPSPAPSRRSPVARSRARSRSSSSARNGGGFFNTNSATRSRTRRRSPTSSSSTRSCSSRSRWRSRSGGWSRTSARAAPCSRS